jgi:hypothetical protein
MFEELLALGRVGAEYDAWLIKIGDGDQCQTAPKRDPFSGASSGEARSLRITTKAPGYNGIMAPGIPE